AARPTCETPPCHRLWLARPTAPPPRRPHPSPRVSPSSGRTAPSRPAVSRNPRLKPGVRLARPSGCRPVSCGRRSGIASARHPLGGPAMFGFEPEAFIPYMIFAIPIVAIVGGITIAIVRSLGRQRLIELAQQERIAAIQRGIEPSKLAPLPVLAEDDDLTPGLSPAERDRRPSPGLLIGGIVTFAAGGGR